MVRHVVLLVLAGGVLIGAAIGAQAPARDSAPRPTGSTVIRGRVLAAADGSPIRKARVRLSGAAEQAPAFTDGDGRFTFTALPAGRYIVSASKAGYADSTFGARRSQDRGLTVVTTDAAVVDRIDILMPKGAAITGRVIDDLGDPVVGLRVTGGRVVHNEGRARLTQTATAETDDLGEYRLGGLAAGAYIVSVSPGQASPDGLILFGGPTEGGLPIMPRTYYPATTSLAQAQSIPVAAGEEVPAIDFALTPIGAPALSITVTDERGSPAAGTFMLTSTSAIDALNRSGPIRDGAATTGVEPGDWLVQVNGPQGSAMTTVTVGTDDASVNLVLRTPGRLSGRIAFDGARPPAGARDTVLFGVPRGVSSVAQARRLPSTTIKADGTFVMTNLIGRWDFQLRNAPPGWHLQSMTMQGRSLLDEPVEFRGGETWTDVVVTLTNRHAELTGTVVDGDKTPVRDYSLIVFPEQRTRRANVNRWSRWVRPDQRGRFVVNDLPAGSYFAIALGEVDEDTWWTDAYLEAVRDRATRITVGEDGSQAIVLEVVRTP
jgi:hypothetical protein